jgi:Peptidase family M23
MRAVAGTFFFAAFVNLTASYAAPPIAPHDPPTDTTSASPFPLQLETEPRKLGAGATVIVFMWVSFDPGAHVPNRLRHRVLTADSSVEGADIDTHYTPLRTLGPPVAGANWVASDGPSNAQSNHHRRGIFIVDGRAVISRRYAVDLQQIEHGARFPGNASDTRSYFVYGKPVLAVADAKVVTARDGLPDNVAGHFEAFHPAVTITMDTADGNSITLDLGGGQYAHYFHLQPGSLRVKMGDYVHRGELLARVGASGDAREPHLHFEVTTSPKLLAGEGVPYLIDHFRLRSEDGTWLPRTHESVLDGMLIDFGPVAGL